MVKTNTFKETYFKELELLFLKEGFANTALSHTSINGFLELIDALSDYHEEGEFLHPEVLIISDWEYFEEYYKGIDKVKIGGFVIASHKDFEAVLKYSAPLAVNGWMIFIEYNPNGSPPNCVYGVFTIEKNELSESISDKIFSKKSTKMDYLNCVLVRNIGQKCVLLKGIKGNEQIFTFSTKKVEKYPFDSVGELAKSISLKVTVNKKKVRKYFHKIIYDAINLGHGTLIGVVRNDIIFDYSIFSKYILFDVPINFPDLITKVISDDTPYNHYVLKGFSNIIRSSINNDGITLFSEDGKMLGYHFLIQKKAELQSAGGSRRQAFEAMKSSGMFSSCFYKSQDGNTHFEKVK